MAILSRAGTYVLGSETTFTINKTDLANHGLVSSNGLFSQIARWKHVYIIFKSSTSIQKKIIHFDMELETPISHWTPTSGFQGDAQIDAIIIVEKDGGRLLIPRSKLNALDFDHSYSVGGGGGGGSDLLSNGDFASGDLTSWTSVANAPASNLPTIETFSPSSGSYTLSAPSGANNYYIEGPNGDDSTTEGHIYQDVNVSGYQGERFTINAKVGGRFSDDGVHIEAIFLDKLMWLSLIATQTLLI